MTSFSDPVKSQAIVVYTPQEHPLAKAEAHMKEMQDLAMEKSFKAQVADHQHFHSSSGQIKGRVIMLTGTSSVGKSTIINGLREFNPKIIEENADLVGGRNMYEFMEKNYSKFGVSKEDWENWGQLRIRIIKHVKD